MNIKKIILTVIIGFCSSLASANVVGTDLQNFNPNSNGLDFVSVYSSDTLTPGVINFGAFWMYQTNSMPFFEIGNATSGQKFAEPNDTMTSADLHLGIGITKGWDIGVGANSVLSQDIEDSSQLGTYSATGLTDFRVNTKIRVYKGETSGFAIVGGVNFDRVGNNPFSGLEDSPSYSLDLAYDSLLNEKWRWGLNLGYRLRGSGTPITSSGVTPVPDQVTYSAALSYLAKDWDSNFIFELFGSSPTGEMNTPTDRDTSNLEAILGWRWNLHKRFDIHAGLGREVYHGLSTPDLRGYVGFNWRIGPLWGGSSDDNDRDGVPNSEDRCPSTIKSERNSVNRWGCADSDQDGVFNGEDQCPGSPAGSTVDEKGCAVTSASVVSDWDTDRDGVANNRDQCPNTEPGVQVDDMGCDLKRVRKIRLDQLNFVTGSARLTSSSKEKFNNIISTLSGERANIQKIIVEGHTDSRGKAAMNKALSQKRAERIAELLSENIGIDRSQCEAFGYGEEQPIADNATRAGQLKNRRVELRLIRSK